MTLDLIRAGVSAVETAPSEVMPPPMRSLKVLFALLMFGTLSGQVALPSYGPQDAEVGPDRAQQWLIPSPTVDRPARAMLFRPVGDGPFRLAVIAHAST